MKKIFLILILISIFSYSKNEKTGVLRSFSGLLKEELEKKYSEYGIDLKNEKEDISYENGKYYLNIVKDSVYTCENNDSEEKTIKGKIALNEILKIRCVNGKNKINKYMKWLINLDNLQEFSMGNIDSLSPEVKKQIQRIYLSSYLLNKRVIDIKKLLQLKNLKKIELHDSIIENFEDIEEFENLEEVSIIDSEIIKSDFTKIGKKKKLLKLKTVFLDRTEGIENIDFLKNSKNLKFLSISETGIKDISILNNLNQLEILYMTGNGIKDISSLRESRNLRNIRMSSNEIKDISFIGNNKNLEELGISFNRIENIEVLRNFSNLEFLSVENNPIKDFSVIRKLEKLRYLEFDILKSKEEIKNILPLSLYEYGKLNNDEIYEGKASAIEIIKGK